MAYKRQTENYKKQKKAKKKKEKKRKKFKDTFLLNALIVNLTTGIDIITRFLSRTPSPPYSTILPVSNSNRFCSENKIINRIILIQ